MTVVAEACDGREAVEEWKRHRPDVSLLDLRMPAELTDRELVVLRALAKGLNNKAIGRSLFITEATVKAHLKSIFTKLNVLSRTEAIAAAARRGIVQL